MRPNSFDDIDRLLDRMQRFTGSDDGVWNAGSMDSSAVKVDVSDHGEELVVVADLPGFDREEIDLTVEESRLTIAASHETTAEDEAANYVHRERARRAVRRTVSLPTEVDAEDASATYTNGVLTVTLPALTGSSGHRIDIE
jgi:HSP20 family protein